jgi:hypothetical protein
MSHLKIKILKTKIIFIILCFIAIFLLFIDIALAQVLYKPQIPLPETKFVGPVQITGTTLAELIRALFKWGIRVIAILAVIMIMVAGVQWMLAMGNQSKINQAKDKISSALMGLILALGAHFLLSFINPALVNLVDLSKYVIPISKIYMKVRCKDIPPEQQPDKEKATTEGIYAWPEGWYCGRSYQIKPLPDNPGPAGICWGDDCPLVKSGNQPYQLYCDFGAGLCESFGERCCSLRPPACSTLTASDYPNWVCATVIAPDKKNQPRFCLATDLLNCPSGYTRVNCIEGGDVCWNFQENRPRWQWNSGVPDVCDIDFWSDKVSIGAMCRDQNESAGKFTDLICCKKENENKYILYGCFDWDDDICRNQK